MQPSRVVGADRRHQLLALIADGDVHSGADLAQRLAVSRTAIWQYAEALGNLGVKVYPVRGHGYRLEHPIELLDGQAIRTGLGRSARTRLRELHVHFVTDSTNERLAQLAARGDVHAHACLAELQTAGRGRRGRQWLAPLGSGICLSLAWQFNSALEALAGLSLAVGVSVRRALGKLGIDEGLALKWPNDVMYRGCKMAGILVEVSGEMTGPCLAIIGIGINVALPQEVAEAVNHPATDLRAAMEILPSRNHVAASALNELIEALAEFESGGFGAFAEEWKQHDGLRGHAIDVSLPAETVSGVAEGIDAGGALLVRVGDELRRFHSGEVSVRRAP